MTEAFPEPAGKRIVCLSHDVLSANVRESAAASKDGRSSENAMVTVSTEEDTVDMEEQISEELPAGRRSGGIRKRKAGRNLRKVRKETMNHTE
jgi:hypothetical protein